MNFISHYYCHYTNSDYFNFGLLFPDLLGLVDSKFKLNHFLKHKEIEDVNFELGIKHHVLADKIWHNHPYFIEKTYKIKQVLKEFDLYNKPYRPFFMTHVMLEILLDRAIVKYEQQVALGMYNSLANVDVHFISKLFIEEERASRFWAFFKNFNENRYTLSYTNNEMFIYALNRLFARVKHPAIEMEQTNKFVRQLDEIIENDYKQPLTEISNERIR